MNLLIASLLFFTQWYYIPLESPASPVEIEAIDLNLKRDELAFTFFLLTDGEVALIQHPNGENVLINSGGNGSEQELRNLLNLYHVDKISKIILTEGENCCNKNVNWLIDEYNVTQVIGSEFTFQVLRKSLRENISVHQLVLTSGLEQEIAPGLSCKVLSVDHGLNLSFNFSNHQIFWLNQLDSNVGKDLTILEQGNTTVVKLPSRAPEAFIMEALLERLDPHVAFFFPEKNEKVDKDLLEQLQHSWVPVYYNKHKGAITIKFTNNNYELFKVTDQEK